MAFSHATSQQVSLWCTTMELPSVVGTSQLRQQYKSLALKYHPDKKPHGNGQRFADIQCAFRSLLPYGEKHDVLHQQHDALHQQHNALHQQHDALHQHHKDDSITSFIQHAIGESVNHESFCNVIQQLITKYNLSISEIPKHIDMNILLHLINTVTTNDITSKVLHSSVFDSFINTDKRNIPTTTKFNNAQVTRTTPSSPSTITVTVSMQDIYNDTLLTVVIPTNGKSIQYKVPAIYETMTFKEGLITTTIHTHLINESMFEIYEESHLSLVHHITLEQYFTKIEFTFTHLDGQQMNIDLKDPHCTCKHYLDGIYCRYQQLGLPMEHQGKTRGDLFVCFNIRRDLEQYL